MIEITKSIFLQGGTKAQVNPKQEKQLMLQVSVLRQVLFKAINDSAREKNTSTVPESQRNCQHGDAEEIYDQLP